MCLTVPATAPDSLTTVPPGNQQGQVPCVGCLGETIYTIISVIIAFVSALPLSNCLCSENSVNCELCMLTWGSL